MIQAEARPQTTEQGGTEVAADWNALGAQFGARIAELCQSEPDPSAIRAAVQEFVSSCLKAAEELQLEMQAARGNQRTEKAGG